MELNTQRTVSGLALLPRSVGDSGWEGPHVALPGEPPAQHRPGCPPTTASCSPPAPLPAAPHVPQQHLTDQGPGIPCASRASSQRAPGTAARGSTAPAVLLFTDSLSDLKNAHSRQTCNEAAHDSAPRTLCSHRHTLQTPPVLFAFAGTLLSWKKLQQRRWQPRPKGSRVHLSACDWNDRNGLKPSPERTENLTYKEIGVNFPQHFL